MRANSSTIIKIIDNAISPSNDAGDNKKMRAVFLDKKTFKSNIDLSSIEHAVSSLTCYQTTTPKDIISRCADADIIISNKVVLDADTLALLPKLKLICVAATGINNVDVKAAKAQNVVVTNISGYAKNSVAQYVFAQLLEWYNQTSHHNRNTKDGLWQKSDTFCVQGNVINELAGKTMGIIGFGALGQSVAKIAAAFDMEVLIAERENASNIRQGRIAYDELLAEADIISLHCPQTTENEGMVNAAFIEQLKPTALLINTARGPLINNDDLLEGLKNNKLAGAILDVLDEEPPSPNHPLLTANCANLIITAHIAWASSEAQQRLIEILASNIDSFQRGQCQNRVN